MSAVVGRVEALIARSLDLSGTSEEERRSSAVIACRLIHEHRLLSAPARRVFVEPDEPHRKVIRSRFEGTCFGCAEWYGIGTPVAWARGVGSICVECHKNASAAS